ncbi:hypothetical protein B0T21DRAFT_121315 [Apiosordaria backusii]|uniref:Uncharacterized protein n=1 Tax=Apiosordaria backusii TaxID=314023 RepID=A0AA40EM83_9PEZI|nr:hypothetical protein B0T21DRAFT_121315 [Apiosordaria backusii]
MIWDIWDKGGTTCACSKSLKRVGNFLAGFGTEIGNGRKRTDSHIDSLHLFCLSLVFFLSFLFLGDFVYLTGAGVYTRRHTFPFTLSSPPVHKRRSFIFFHFGHEGFWAGSGSQRYPPWFFLYTILDMYIIRWLHSQPSRHRLGFRIWKKNMDSTSYFWLLSLLVTIATSPTKTTRAKSDQDGFRYVINIDIMKQGCQLRRSIA